MQHITDESCMDDIGAPVDPHVVFGNFDHDNYTNATGSFHLKCSGDPHTPLPLPPSHACHAIVEPGKLPRLSVCHSTAAANGLVLISGGGDLFGEQPRRESHQGRFQIKSKFS